MASYNFMKAGDRSRCRADRKAEIAAVREGRWPRDINDEMRWLYAHPHGVGLRIVEGDVDLTGWEAPREAC